MEPIENEPHGWAENEERHNSFSTSKDDNNDTREDASDTATDLAGVAAGNVPADGEAETKGQESQNNDPRGFMGDFAEPQQEG